MYVGLTLKRKCRTLEKRKKKKTEDRNLHTYHKVEGGDLFPDRRQLPPITVGRIVGPNASALTTSAGSPYNNYVSPLARTHVVGAAH